MKFAWIGICAAVMFSAAAHASEAVDVSASPVSDSEQKPRQWLQRMADAIKHENYQGVLVFGNNKAWHTLSVNHAIIDGVEYEKISHLTGMPREIVRNGSTVTYDQAGISSVFRDQGSQLLSGVDPDTPTLDEFYRLDVSSKAGRVAGHTAIKLKIRPVDEYRFGQNLWLDADTGLLLRSDLLDKNNKLLERYQFAQVDIGKPQTIADFESANVVPLTTSLTDAQAHNLAGNVAGGVQELAITKPSNWYPEWVPPGFSLTGSRVGQQSGETAMYSDGLTAFTLFVDPIEHEAIPNFSKRWGATCAVVRHQQLGDANMRITVVGELPVQAAQKIASSVRFRDKN